MYETEFEEFLKGVETLRIYSGEKLVFTSEKDRLIPLVEYLDIPDRPDGIVILDRVTGNAAALLSVLAGCAEVYSPLGSEIAVKTLERHAIRYHFDKTVPFIQRPDSEEMCPMEALSLEKGPEEFYKALVEKIR